MVRRKSLSPSLLSEKVRENDLDVATTHEHGFLPSSSQEETKSRVMCVWIPRFGLALYCKEDPHLLVESSVLAESKSDSAVISEVSGKASKSGVAVGMTIAQAGMLCDDLVVKVKDHDREISASNEIFEAIQSIAPFIEVDCPGRYFVSASGFERLYGGEQALAERIIQSIKTLGLFAQIGISDNVFAARIAAEITSPAGINLIKQNRAQEFLEPLPVKHLAIDDEIKAQLVELGLRTIGQIAAFPINELTERFGNQGALMAHLAKGNDPKHFTPETPVEDISEQMILDVPVFSAISISARVQKLLMLVLDKIAAKELGAIKLAILLKFENRTYKELELALDRPSLSVRKFLQQLHRQLERLTFPAGVIELKLIPIAMAPLRVKQAELASRPTYKSIATTEQSVEIPILFRAELRKSALPEESFALIPETPSPLTPLPKGERENFDHTPFAMQPMTGMRLVQPAQPIEVVSKDVSLRSVFINRQRHVIVHQNGPWKVSGRWWGDAYTRLYYEIETKDKRVFLIYQLGGVLDGKWYLQGMFD